MQHEENDTHLSKKNSENENSLHASICLDNTLVYNDAFRHKVSFIFINRNAC